MSFEEEGPTAHLIHHAISSGIGPGLIGRKFYLQGGVTDPGVNALHLVVSNAVEATIGAR